MIKVTVLPLMGNRFNEYESLLLDVRHGVNLHPAWFAAYIEAFNLKGKELILEARDTDNGNLIGFLPLFQRDDHPTRFFKHRWLLPLGYRPTDFFDIVSLPGKSVEVGQAFAKWFKVNLGAWDRLKINFIPSDSPNWECFVKCLKEEGFEPVFSQEQSYFKLDTTIPYSEYLRKLGGAKQRNIRIFKNKLLEEGDLLFEHIGIECAAYFDEFVSVYTDRRNALNQSNPLTRSYMPQHEFMKKIIQEYAKRGWARLSILKLNDIAIAYLYHFIYNGVDYYSMPALVEEYKMYAPGKVMLMEIIRIAFEDPGIVEFNFMRFEAPYKAWFRPERETYVSITVDNPWSWRNKALPILQYLSKLKQSLS